MLFCSEANVALYARFRFRAIAAPVFPAHSSGKRRALTPAMWRPLQAGATWPGGDVKLPGAPF